MREIGEIANPIMIRGSIGMFAANIVPMLFSELPFFDDRNIHSIGTMLYIWFGFIFGVSILMGAVRTEVRK
ncbi:MAG: hypothetical protein EOP04_07905 [Proteobacteria bacterium]|nr:MAG: hypothetical protein EOP04_07905 [Pseudomonadota bacterium]